MRHQELDYDVGILHRIVSLFFSPVTWLLIVGALLFCTGCFVPISALDTIFRIFDVRLWPWWYLPCIAILTFFGYRWSRFLKSFQSDKVYEISLPFIRLSIVVSLEIVLFILLHLTGVLEFIYDLMWRMFGFGEFSWLVWIVLSVGFGMFAGTLWCLREWWRFVR